MSAIITDLFRIHNAQQFVEALAEPDTASPAEETAAESGTQRTRLYFFIGRPQEWRAYLELYAINNTFQERRDRLSGCFLSWWRYRLWYGRKSVPQFGPSLWR